MAAALSYLVLHVVVGTGVMAGGCIKYFRDTILLFNWVILRVLQFSNYCCCFGPALVDISVRTFFFLTSSLLVLIP